jgi:hypothetical protein
MELRTARISLGSDTVATAITYFLVIISPKNTKFLGPFAAPLSNSLNVYVRLFFARNDSKKA